MRRAFACFLLAALVLTSAPHAQATITISVQADSLRTGTGAAAPTTTLAMIVADTDANGLGTAIIGTIATNASLNGSGGDDLILFRTNLANFGTPGVLETLVSGLDFANDPNGKWGPNDRLYLVWFPTLTTASTTLSLGASYGVIDLGVTPADGSVERFTYVSPTNSGHFSNLPVPPNATDQSADKTSSSGNEPEIVVSGNLNNIADGSTGTSLLNHTDFGSALAAGGSVTRTFTLTNTGASPLTVDNLIRSGPHAADFQINPQPGSLVAAAGGTTSFQVTFTPSTSGNRMATLTFGNNDSDENPFNFAISGTGTNSGPSDITLSGASIAENNALGATIGTLTAADLDAGDSHSFTLVSGSGSTDNGAFTISNATLSINTAADFEQRQSYSIRVRATDNGSPNLWVEKAFTVLVTDLNEAPTAISLSGQTIPENSAIGTVIGSLSAVDPDANATHTFTLVDGDGASGNGSFQINGNQLRFAGSPNYEAQHDYSVRIRATDGGSLTTEASFAITISDINEAPSEIALNGDSLPENGGDSATVGTLSATDPDAGSIHTFTLVAGTGDNDNGAFSLSGGDTLILLASADYEAKSSYNIRVRATDNGTESLTFDKELTVHITDVNEAPHHLTLTASAIAEASPIGTLVGTFSALDPDLGDLLTFSFADGNGDTDNLRFSLSGADLKIAEIPDFEAKASYSLRIRAKDSGNPGLFVEAVFAIRVIDVDETPGDIVLSAASINENNSLGTEIGSFTLNDPATTEPGVFALVAGEGSGDNESFTLNGNRLILNEVANFEGKESYSIRLQCTDQSTPPRIAEEVFLIAIRDVNEMPIFTKGADQVLAPGASGARMVANWATAIEDGDSEATQR